LLAQHGTDDPRLRLAHLHELTGDTAGAAFSELESAEITSSRAQDKRDWSDALAQYRATEQLGAQSGDGQDQRVAARFALIALAGEIATEYGVLPWPPGTAALAAATILRDSHGERVGGNNEPQQIIDQVVAFIDREESRFERDYSPLDLATEARAGWTDKNGNPTAR
jgi:putative DNA primase/helicase